MMPWQSMLRRYRYCYIILYLYSRAHYYYGAVTAL